MSPRKGCILCGRRTERTVSIFTGETVHTCLTCQLQVRVTRFWIEIWKKVPIVRSR